MISYLVPVTSLLVFGIANRKRPVRAGRVPFALLAALLYLFIRIRYFEFARPLQLLYIAAYTVLGRMLYEDSWERLVFDGALYAYLMRIVVLLTYVLPLPEWWRIPGPGNELRLLLICLVQLVLAFIWKRFTEKYSEERTTVCVLVLVAVTMLLENMNMIESFTQAQQGSGITLYNVVALLEVEIIGTCCLFHAWYTQRERAQRNELLLRSQQAMWMEKNENEQQIRRIYHDLKHQIALIENLDTATSTRLAEVLKSQMEEYSPVPESGNLMLDTVLNEKVRQCRADKITLRIQENVCSIDFMDPLDLSVIFGNLLDNAEEAVRQLPEDERSIVLKIRETESVLLINCTNPCRSTLTWKDDLPETTKADRSMHGIGLRSIQKTVMKYDGELRINAEEAKFTAEIVIPLR